MATDATTPCPWAAVVARWPPLPALVALSSALDTLETMDTTATDTELSQWPGLAASWPHVGTWLTEHWYPERTDTPWTLDEVALALRYAVLTVRYARERAGLADTDVGTTVSLPSSLDPPQIYAE